MCKKIRLNEDTVAVDPMYAGLVAQADILFPGPKIKRIAKTQLTKPATKKLVLS